MTSDELKQALLSECEVKYQEIIFKCVYGIIYRKNGGKIGVSAELMDKNNNSICIVDPQHVEFVSK